MKHLRLDPAFARILELGEVIDDRLVARVGWRRIEGAAQLDAVICSRLTQQVWRGQRPRHAPHEDTPIPSRNHRSPPDVLSSLFPTIAPGRAICNEIQVARPSSIRPKNLSHMVACRRSGCGNHEMSGGSCTPG